MLLTALLFFSHLLPHTVAKNDTAKQKYLINNIVIIGNKITKNTILMRELSFAVNDTLSKNELDQKIIKSRENLLNTSLFNFVQIDTLAIGKQKLDVYITVSERWYTLPLPILEVTDPNLTVWWQTKNLEHLNYGAYLVRYNFRGRKENVQIKFQLGFTQQFALLYNIPYLDRKQRHGMSFSFGYSHNHEINYATQNNKLLFYKNNSEFIRQELGGRVRYYYRAGIYNTHSVELRYNYGKIADTLTELQSDYYSNNASKTQFFTLSYLFKRDLRDSKYYPLKGYYLDGDITRFGLGVLNNEPVGINKIECAAKIFVPIYKRLYAAAGLKGKASDNPAKQYYFIQRGLGYTEYVRGYEYYVIDAQKYILARSNLKYEIVKPHKQKINFINNSRFDTFHYAFYGNLFFDAAYTEDKKYFATNTLSNKYIWGTGMGIDFVTYYDSVFRFEIAMNDLKEKGFFLHFTAPI